MNPITSFKRGMAHALGGLRYVYRDHPSLARFYVWPIVIMGGALYFAFRYVFRSYESWGASLWAAPDGEGFFAWVAEKLHTAFELAVLGIALALALLVAALVSSLVAAPFNDALSEAVEELETGKGGPPLSLAGIARDVARTLRVELGKLGIYAGVMVPLFVVSLLVPGVGQAIYTVFGVLFTLTYFAIDYVDWPASRRGLGLDARLALLREHKSTMLGFGAGVWVLLLIPIVNLFFMPAAVAGGTRLFLDLEANRSLPPSVKPAVEPAVEAPAPPQRLN